MKAAISTLATVASIGTCAAQLAAATALTADTGGAAVATIPAAVAFGCTTAILSFGNAHLGSQTADDAISGATIVANFAQGQPAAAAQEMLIAVPSRVIDRSPSWSGGVRISGQIFEKASGQVFREASSNCPIVITVTPRGATPLFLNSHDEFGQYKFAKALPLGSYTLSFKYGTVAPPDSSTIEKAYTVAISEGSSDSRVRVIDDETGNTEVDVRFDPDKGEQITINPKLEWGPLLRAEVVTGNIVDGHTKVPGATVTLTDYTGRVQATESAANGRFSLEFAADSGTLTISRRYFNPLSIPITSDSNRSVVTLKLTYPANTTIDYDPARSSENVYHDMPMLSVFDGTWKGNATPSPASYTYTARTECDPSDSDYEPQDITLVEQCESAALTLTVDRTEALLTGTNASGTYAFRLPLQIDGNFSGTQFGVTFRGSLTEAGSTNSASYSEPTKDYYGNGEGCHGSITLPKQ